MATNTVNDAVTLADQQNINTFGKFNNRLHELEAMVQAKERLLEDLEDAENELMLSDDDVVRYAIGECFVHLDKDEAEAKLEDTKSAAKRDVDRFKSELVSVKQQLLQLKATLYGKFGNSINLEED